MPLPAFYCLPGNLFIELVCWLASVYTVIKRSKVNHRVFRLDIGVLDIFIIFPFNNEGTEEYPDAVIAATGLAFIVDVSDTSITQN